MQKEQDWKFYLKIGISIFGVLCILSFLIGTKWSFQTGQIEQYSQERSILSTNPQKPLRVQIMSLNTISLFFLFMCISEYRANEITSPFGVDPDKIPDKCKREQSVFLSFFMSFCVIILLYNFMIVPFLLQKATKENLSIDKSRTERGYYSRSIEDVIKSVTRLQPKNGMFMVQTNPTVIEFMFFMLIAVLSILLYVLFILHNYNVIDVSFFQSCFHPLNNDRFYDPYE